MPAITSPLAAISWGTAVTNPDISVYFAPDGVEVGEYTSEGLSAYEIGQFEQLFDVISSITNVSFTVTDEAGADFVIGMDDDELLGELDGQMGPPGEDGEGLGIFDGQNIDRAPGGPLDQGGYDFMVFTHELMHGLGLAHPHDDGGGSPIMDGVEDAFGDYGDFDLNQGVFTVMTYNNGYFTGTPGSEPDEFDRSYGYEAEPMALDIAVLQSLYGANVTTATGDNLYELPDANEAGTGWQAIWDNGGTDEIRYEGDQNATIDLRAATLEYDEGGGGWVSSVEGIAGGYTIANGVVIENATTGGGTDTVTGNAAANLLAAGGSDDTVAGGEGEDTILGGEGDDDLSGGGDGDTFQSASGDGTDVISDFILGEDVLVFDGIEFGSDAGQTDPADFLAANGTIDGTDLVITLDGTHSVRLVDVVDPGDTLDDFVDVFAAMGSDDFGATEGPDTLEGSEGPDTIDGLGGRDLINGNGDDDSLIGGEGQDTVNGGDGNDTILGGDQRDILTGNDGDDSIEGGDGNDVIFGNHGNETLLGGDGDDRIGDWTGDSLLDGGNGKDLLLAGNGEDILLGGAGKDKMFGGNGDDLLIGVDDVDKLFGERGEDTLLGEGGNDRLTDTQGDSLLDGGTGDDRLRAGAGDDTLIGGEGDDLLRGEKGNDLFVQDEGDGNDIIQDFKIGEDLLSLLDVDFGDGEGQITVEDFLINNARIQDDTDLFLDLGEGRSIKLLKVVDEENIGDDVEDYVDIVDTAL